MRHPHRHRSTKAKTVPDSKIHIDETKMFKEIVEHLNTLIKLKNNIQNPEKKHSPDVLKKAVSDIDQFFNLIDRFQQAFPAIWEKTRWMLGDFLQKTYPALTMNKKRILSTLCAEVSVLQFQIANDAYGKASLSVEDNVALARKIITAEYRSFPRCHSPEQIFDIGGYFIEHFLDYVERTQDFSLILHLAERGHLRAVNVLYQLYAKQGDFEKALHWVEQRIRLAEAATEHYQHLAKFSLLLFFQHREEDPSKARAYLQKSIHYYQHLADQNPADQEACQHLVFIYREQLLGSPRPELLVKYCRRSTHLHDQLLLVNCLYNGHGTVKTLSEARRILNDLRNQGCTQAELMALNYGDCYTLKEKYSILKNCLESPPLYQRLHKENLIETCRHTLTEWSLLLYCEETDKSKKEIYLASAMQALRADKNSHQLAIPFLSHPTAGEARKILNQWLGISIDDKLAQLSQWLSLKEYFVTTKNSRIHEKIYLITQLAALIDQGFAREFIQWMSEPEYIDFIQNLQFVNPPDAQRLLDLLSKLPIDPQEPPEKALIHRVIKVLSSTAIHESIHESIFVKVYVLLSRVGLPDDSSLVTIVLKMIRQITDDYQPSTKNLCLALYSLTFLHIKHPPFGDQILKTVAQLLKKLEDTRHLMNLYDIEQLKTSCVYFQCAVGKSHSDELIREINTACSRLFTDIVTKVQKDSDLKSELKTQPSAAQRHIARELSRYFAKVKQEVVLQAYVNRQTSRRAVDFVIDDKVIVEYDGPSHYLFNRQGQAVNTPKTELRNFLLQYKFKNPAIIQLGEFNPLFPHPRLNKDSFEWSRQCFLFFSAAFKDYCQLPIINFYVCLTWRQQNDEVWRKDFMIGGYLSHFDLWRRPSQIQKFFHQSANDFYYQLARKDGLFAHADPMATESTAPKNLRFVPVRVRRTS